MSEPITGSLICFSHEFAGAYLLEYSRKADRTIALPLTWISLDSENPAQRWVSCGIHQRTTSSGSHVAFGLSLTSACTLLAEYLHTTYTSYSKCLPLTYASLAGNLQTTHIPHSAYLHLICPLLAEQLHMTCVPLMFYLQSTCK